MDLHTLPFIVVDVETTGGAAWGSDRVTDVAAVYVEGDRIEVVFESLVNPGRPIPWHITHLTGITDEMVRGAPRFEDIAGEFAAHLVGRVFVAHNVSFDFGFLDAEFSRIAPTPLESLVTGQLCTVRLARKLLSHLPRRNLDAVCAHYGVQITDRHRASGDALATAAVLRGLLRDAERQGVYTWNALDELLSRGTGRRKRRSALPGFSAGSEGA